MEYRAPMPRARTGHTRNRILAVALDLFREQGVRETSLRQIAERLGITKPALYYYFDSRLDLVRSLLQPLIDDIDRVLAEDETTTAPEPRDLLGRYFDVSYRHRTLFAVILRDLSELGFIDQVLQWRQRVVELLVGRDAPIADQARAIVALGGLADCLVLLPDVPEAELRTAALDAACDALGAERAAVSGPGGSVPAAESVRAAEAERPVPGTRSHHRG